MSYKLVWCKKGTRGLSNHRKEPNEQSRLNRKGVCVNQCDLESGEFVLKNVHFSKQWTEISDIYLKPYSEFWNHRGTLIILSAAHFLDSNLIFKKYSF